MAQPSPTRLLPVQYLSHATLHTPCVGQALYANWCSFRSEIIDCRLIGDHNHIDGEVTNSEVQGNYNHFHGGGYGLRVRGDDMNFFHKPIAHLVIQMESSSSSPLQGVFPNANQTAPSQSVPSPSFINTLFNERPHPLVPLQPFGHYRLYDAATATTASSATRD